MYVYLIMLLISLAFAWLATNAKPFPEVWGSYCFFAVLSFLPFAIVSMFRWQVGTDWPLYDSYYYYINHGIKEFTEPLFNLLNKLLYQITPNSVLLFAVVSFLTLMFFFLGIYHDSEMIPFSILLFFLSGRYFTSLNQIRQMLAMGIFIFSLRYLFRRRIVPYMLCIVIACTIHISSAIYCPIYFLYGFRYKSKTILYGVAAFCVSYPVIRTAARPLISLTKFAWYFDSSYDTEDFYLLGFIVAFLIFCMHLIGLYRQERLLTANGEPSDTKRQGFMTVMALLACMILTLSSVIPQVSRISEAFSVVQILGIPSLVKMEKDNRWRLCYVLFVVALYGAKLLYDVYKNGWNTVIPYQSVFFA